MSDASDFQHLPVMRDEIVAVFANVPAGTIVDATVGGGGHAAALLEARDDVAVVGLDRDPDALTAARAALAGFGDRATLIHARYDRLPSALADAGAERISGALFDLGVSSPQLDRADRGFSYQHEGPLDMRMDTTSPLTAADIVNEYDEARLATVLRRFGDERYARRIAAAIVAARPIDTTTALAAVVTDAIPAPARRRGGHPAKRSFQAIRIEVNSELDVLRPALESALEVMVPGGRLAVLTYHSGEDRIVKDTMRTATGACNCPPGLPCVCGAVERARLVRGIARTPSDAEVVANRRAASARLRVVERLVDRRRGSNEGESPTDASSSRRGAGGHGSRTGNHRRDDQSDVELVLEDRQGVC